MSSNPRIRLVPATARLLLALRDDPGTFADALGSPVPAGWPEFPEAIEAALRHAHDASAAAAPWSMHFFVDEGSGRLVGSGGFTGPPAGPPGERTVEIGYEVAPAFRGRGLGVAAARALIEHALATGEVDRVVAHTLPGPNPSTGVLASLGFAHTGEREDPQVGAVWAWAWAAAGGTA